MIQHYRQRMQQLQQCSNQGHEEIYRGKTMTIEREILVDFWNLFFNKSKKEMAVTVTLDKHADHCWQKWEPHLNHLDKGTVEFGATYFSA